MHTVLTLQITIRIITFDIDRHALDTGLITLLKVRDRDFITIILGPTHIHTHQHRSPILAFRTARTGIDLKYATHLVRLIAQHIAELQLLDQMERLFVGLINLFLADNLLFHVCVSQFQFLGRCLHLMIKLDPFLQLLHLLHLRLSPFGIFPKAGILRAQLFLF